MLALTDAQATAVLRSIVLVLREKEGINVIYLKCLTEVLSPIFSCQSKMLIFGVLFDQDYSR